MEYLLLIGMLAPAICIICVAIVLAGNIKLRRAQATLVDALQRELAAKDTLVASLQRLADERKKTIEIFEKHTGIKR